jgi:hypothetical protein
MCSLKDLKKAYKFAKRIEQLQIASDCRVKYSVDEDVGLNVVIMHPFKDEVLYADKIFHIDGVLLLAEESYRIILKLKEELT